ncbi:hypothetical protein JCM11491_006085 [Sporobolomyces phaffii]
MTYSGSFGIEALSAAYSDGTAKPTSIVEAVHARIVAYSASNPHVWIDLVPLADLLARAHSLESEYAERRKPPLFGIPFSVKNNIDVVGLRTTAGCAAFAYEPIETARVVDKCLAAGAILVGTTNLEQFATGLTGCRSPYGTPSCHHSPRYCAGGSSSGSAVSVAADLVSFSLGTDTAGSVRVPAALNGVVGFKPTFGRVSKCGVVPAVKTLDCVGVLAQSTTDATTVWNVIKGYDERDVYSRSDEHYARLERWDSRGELRVGVPPRALAIERLADEYKRLWEAVLETLGQKRLVTNDQSDYDPFEKANEMVYGSSLVAQRVASFDDFLAKHGTSSLHPVIQTIFDDATGKYSAIDAFRDLDRVAQLKRLVERQFREEIDVLVVPSTAKHYTIAQVEADHFGTNRVLGTFSQFVNLLDLCAISIPVATWKDEEGVELSFGMTLIAEAGRDDDLLELARRL